MNPLLLQIPATRMNPSSARAVINAYPSNIYATERQIATTVMTKICGSAQLVSENTEEEEEEAVGGDFIYDRISNVLIVEQAVQ